MNDGFAAKVETCVHNDRHTSDFAKLVDKLIVPGIDFGFDGLRAGGAVDVRDTGNYSTLLRADLRGEDHKGRVKSGFKVVGRTFFF